jgi:hypothetical protein
MTTQELALVVKAYEEIVAANRCESWDTYAEVMNAHESEIVYEMLDVALGLEIDYQEETGDIPDEVWAMIQTQAFAYQGRLRAEFPELIGANA